MPFVLSRFGKGVGPGRYDAGELAAMKLNILSGRPQQSASHQWDMA
jgi:hypothetical protein